MKRKYWIVAIGLIFFLILLIALQGLSINNKDQVSKSGTTNTNRYTKSIALSQLDNNIWVHTSYLDYNGVKTPSNGLIVVTTEGLLLIDTPWNSDQTKELLEIAEDKFQQSFVKAIITHAHSDRIGGIDVLIQNNVETYSTNLTQELSVKNGYEKPETTIESGEVIGFGGQTLEVFYPGEGHSKDNIVIWLPEKKILFAGCMVKSLDAKNLGNVAESNLKEWAETLKKVQKNYSDALIIIPGHGQYGDMKLLEHTLRLINQSE